MSYSVDLRTKVLDYINNGGKISRACKIFTVSRSSIQRWRNKKDATGDVSAKNRVATPYKIDDDELKKYIKTHSDAYLSEIAAYFKVSESGICRALARLKITRKKSLRFTQKETKLNEKNL